MPYKNKEKQKEYQKQHYLKNKNKYRKTTKNNRKRNKEFVHCLKKQCVECGCNDKLCLDFHHLKDKNRSLAQLIRDAVSLDILQKEIDKCQVLCANCHKKQHLPKKIKDGSEWKGFAKNRIAKRLWYIDYISKQKCNECGEDDSRCLEFHHKLEKRFHVSYLLTSGHTLDFLKEEIARCELLCVNCHRKKHYYGD